MSPNRSSNGTLSSTPELGIRFSGMRGTIGYDERKGLFGNNLAGKLWSQPVKGTLAMEDGATTIKVNGNVAVADLEREMSLPLTWALSGKTSFDARLVIPPRGAQSLPQLVVDSGLKCAISIAPSADVWPARLLASTATSAWLNRRWIFLCVAQPDKASASGMLPDSTSL